MPNYESQQNAINRKRALAQALQQQAFTPIDMPQVAGANVHATQGLAPIVAALFAGLINRKLDKKQGALDTARNEERQASTTALMRALIPQDQNQMTVPMAPIQGAPLPMMGGGYEQAPAPVTPEGTRTMTLPANAQQNAQRMATVESLSRMLASSDPQQRELGQFGANTEITRRQKVIDDQAAMAQLREQQNFQIRRDTSAQDQRTAEGFRDRQARREEGAADRATQVLVAGMKQQDSRTPEERFTDLKLREEASKRNGSLSTVEEAAVRKAARAEWMDSGREKNPQMDEMMMRIRELQISQAEQRLKDAQGDGGLTPKQLGSVLSLSNSLKSHPAYTDMLDIDTGMRGLEAGLAQKNGFGDITAMNAFQRMVDPGATVRSEDVTLMQSASSLIQRIFSEYPIEKLRTGAKLPDAVRAQIEQTAKTLYQTRAKNYNESVGRQYKALADAAKIPFAYVGQDFTTATAPAPVGAPATGGAADPLGLFK